jgi:hypothetical protein
MRKVYKSSKGWIIYPSKLRGDDREFLESLDSEIEQQNFVDECVALYRTAFGVDIVNTAATMKKFA